MYFPLPSLKALSLIIAAVAEQIDKATGAPGKRIPRAAQPAQSGKPSKRKIRRVTAQQRRIPFPDGASHLED